MPKLAGYGAINSNSTINDQGESSIDYIDNGDSLIGGTIEVLEVYFASSVPASTNCKIKVWRQSGSDLLLISESSLIDISSLGSGLKRIIPSTGLPCQSGDFVGLWFETGVVIDMETGSGNFLYKANDNSGTQAEGDFTSNVGNIAWLAAEYDFITTGDSISIVDQIWTSYSSYSFENFYWVNVGNGGYTSDDTDGEIDTFLSLHHATPKVIIEVGWNDINNGRTLAQYQTSLNSILSKIQTAGKTLTVCKITPYRGGTEDFQSSIKLWNAWLYDWCNANNLELVSSYQELVENDVNKEDDYRTDYSTDGIHPNVVGADEIGRLVTNSSIPIKSIFWGYVFPSRAEQESLTWFLTNGSSSYNTVSNSLGGKGTDTASASGTPASPSRDFIDTSVPLSEGTISYISFRTKTNITTDIDWKFKIWRISGSDYTLIATTENVKMKGKQSDTVYTVKLPTEISVQSGDLIGVNIPIGANVGLDVGGSCKYKTGDNVGTVAISDWSTLSTLGVTIEALSSPNDEIITIPQNDTVDSPVVAIEHNNKLVKILLTPLSGSASIKYRTDSANFDRDNAVISWTDYNQPFLISDKFIQFRITGTSVEDTVFDMAQLSWEGSLYRNQVIIII